MKKTIVILGTLLLTMLLSLPVLAFSFDLDGSYLLTLEEQGLNPSSSGFTVNARASVIGELWLDGSFISTHLDQLVSASALYRVVAERDLAVFVGAGYLNLTPQSGAESNYNGWGLHWKMGLKYLPAPDLVFGAEFAYVPFYHMDEGRDNLLRGRATVTYELYRNLGIMVSVENYKLLQAKNSPEPMVGLGISFRY